MNWYMLFCTLGIIALVWFVQWYAFDYTPRKHKQQAIANVNYEMRMEQLAKGTRNPGPGNAVKPFPPPFAPPPPFLVAHEHFQVPMPTKHPVDLILHCPRCHVQHIDKADTNYDPHYEGELVWTNPPHKSHLCHECGCIWRPADVCTNGVQLIKTKGKNDNW